MTINAVKEIDAWTPEVIRTQVRKYRGDEKAKISSSAVTVLIAFFELDEDDRQQVLESIPAFVCMECGAPSYLHGYSDE